MPRVFYNRSLSGHSFVVATGHIKICVQLICLNFNDGFIILAEYTPENPKITTQCSHHFHLGCIYEWMERSESCPICGKVWTE